MPCQNPFFISIGYLLGGGGKKTQHSNLLESWWICIEIVLSVVWGLGHWSIHYTGTKDSLFRDFWSIIYKIIFSIITKNPDLIYLSFEKINKSMPE